MNKDSILLIISIFGLLNSIDCSHNLKNGDFAEERVLESWINPNYEINESNQIENATSDLSIVYVKSSKFKNFTEKSGPDLHFVLSTYQQSPAFFIVSTENDSNLNIDWNKLKNNEVDSIQFLNSKKEVKLNQNSIGILINKIFFWLDNEKDADYIPGQCIEQKINDKLIWKNVTILTKTKHNVHIQFELKEKVNNGSIKIRFMISSALQQYSDLPNLVLTARSVHTQLTVDGFDEIFPFNYQKRLGLQLTVVSKGEKGIPESTDTFDDEHAPGLFTTVKYPFGKSNLEASFLSFKPYAYPSPKRMMAQAIDTIQKQMNITNSKKDFLQNNAFNGFYGNNSNYNIYQMDITFGSKGQSYYPTTNHTEFSFVTGTGDLPAPHMSLFIKLVIIIGSGLSLLVLLVFPISIYFMARKMKDKRENSLLNNQDSIY